MPPWREEVMEFNTARLEAPVGTEQSPFHRLADERNPRERTQPKRQLRPGAQLARPGDEDLHSVDDVA